MCLAAFRTMRSVVVLLSFLLAGSAQANDRAAKVALEVGRTAVDKAYRRQKPSLLRRVAQPRVSAAMLNLATDAAISGHTTLLVNFADRLGPSHPATAT